MLYLYYKAKRWLSFRVHLTTTPLLIGTANAQRRTPLMPRHVWIVNSTFFCAHRTHFILILMVFTNFGHFHQRGFHFESRNRREFLRDRTPIG